MEARDLRKKFSGFFPPEDDVRDGKKRAANSEINDCKKRGSPRILPGAQDHLSISLG